jgi:hypothetical protein
MQYLDCPNCRARLHSGLLYAKLKSCPRCGAPLGPPQRSLRERLRAAVSRHPRTVVEPPDWEEITKSQYADRRQVNKPDPDAPNGEGAAPE